MSLRFGAEIAENRGGAIGILDGVEGNVADKAAGQDRHHQALQTEAGHRPLLGHAVRQAG